MKTNFPKILEQVYEQIQHTPPQGRSASYIPELAFVNDDYFGMHLCQLDGQHHGVGDDRQKFSIQSIVKVFTLTLAFKMAGNTIFERVDVEPSGNPFNSLVQLEYEQGIPRNPLINSGALVICDLLLSEFRDPKRQLLDFVRTLAGNQNINYNQKIADSESQSGHRNKALINLLKSFDNIQNPVDDVLDFYFQSCAIEMTCEELAHSFLIFANDGRIPYSNDQIISLSESKRINAIMQTCGFYDEAGEFSFRVGLPGKSGVGGGIAAVHPDHYSVAVWSPRLNERGNSALGMKALESLTTLSGLSIF